MRYSGAMSRLANRDVIGGALLLIVGLFMLVGRFAPGTERFVPLLVGLALLGLFFATRSPGALVPGGIVTGVGVGAVAATQGDQQFGGAGFLLSAGAGFLLVSFLGGVYGLREVRVWPLVPGSILIALGAVIFAGRMGGQVLQTATDWWPVVLVVVGAYLLLAARFRRTGAADVDDETRSDPAARDAERAAEERRAIVERAERGRAEEARRREGEDEGSAL
jgi:hypothetical protein